MNYKTMLLELFIREDGEHAPHSLFLVRFVPRVSVVWDLHA
jgi:hypothetical protein